MIQYGSTRGGIEPVGFDDAILQGFAADGGMFVPQIIPRVSLATLEKWASLSYTELAQEVLSLFIDQSIIPAGDLAELIEKSFSTFEQPDPMPLISPGGDESFLIMELFHGPTLSFKDIAMGFLVNCLDYFLSRRNQYISVLLATTGDTGPAAAYASAGKKSIDCWPLYPLGMISEEQKRQMTTLAAENVMPVGVMECKDGGDDLDLTIAAMFRDHALKQELRLSSVNSINWCRVMVQSVHYAYGYFRARERREGPVVFSVPSGAFGNLFAGFLAKQIGIPIHGFICANNTNNTLDTLFSTGVFRKKHLVSTVSSAIDIVVPYNFWRYLYFMAGADHDRLCGWMKQFETHGEIGFDDEFSSVLSKDYLSCSISDGLTLSTIREYWSHFGYLLDPHGAVAVAGARLLEEQYRAKPTFVCLATAHPAKFPGIIHKALEQDTLPGPAHHPSITAAKAMTEKGLVLVHEKLETELIRAMRLRKKQRS